jgi:MFS family permease
MQPFLNTLHFNFALIGLILAATSLFRAIGSSISAFFTNILNKYTGILATLITGISMIIMGSFSFLVLLIAYFIGQIFKGILMPYFSANINSEIDSNVRATMLSLIANLTNILLLLVEYLSAIFIEKTSYEEFFMIGGGIILIFCGPLVVLWRRKSNRHFKVVRTVIPA